MPFNVNFSKSILIELKIKAFLYRFDDDILAVVALYAHLTVPFFSTCLLDLVRALAPTLNHFTS